ncbi:SUMO-interacting motif-containing protein 1 isoform X2 [Anguilla rostrata]|uniref:SUMO-interacting motif-containing protein 1 isoform X2 n=1 Tax=Anguilla rostrata TaxID=7938 RepID=UPI0030CBFBC4
MEVDGNNKNTQRNRLRLATAPHHTFGVQTESNTLNAWARKSNAPPRESGSGSEDDSDIEIVSVYNDTKLEPKEFVREWASLPSPCIDLTDSCWEPQKRRNRRRGNDSLLVAVAVSDNSLSEGEVEPLTSAVELATPEVERKTLCHSPTKSPGKRERTPDFLDNLILENWECSHRHPSPEPREEHRDGKSWSFPWESDRRSPSESSSEEEGIPGSPLSGIPEPARIPRTTETEQETPGSPRPVTVAPGVSDGIPALTAAESRLECETDNAVRDAGAQASPLPTGGSVGESEGEEDKEPGDLGNDFPDYPEATSPLSPFSPYYCPSEIDSRLFSDGSSIHCSQDGEDLDSPPPTPTTPPQGPIRDLLLEDLAYGASPPHRPPDVDFLSDRELQDPPSPRPPPTPSPGPPPFSPGFDQSPPRLSPALRPGVRSVSPTSTEILASDSPDWLGDDAELTSRSPASLLSSGEMGSDPRWSSPGAESPAHSSGPGDSEGEGLSETEAGSGSREASRKDRQYVSRTQLNRLKRLMGRPLQESGGDDSPGSLDDGDDDDEEEDSGPGEPLCRQGLSLVHSSMEERCHDSTLQLLSDFLRPRRYPPPDVVSHLIRAILLGSETPPAQVLQAYSLLMRIQKSLPATVSTVQWDWELMTSAMQERGAERRPVLRLLLQYVLQTLHDDFHLDHRRRQGSIAKATLSCYQAMAHVRDVIGWLVAAVMNSTCDPGGRDCETEMETQKERDENLRIVLVLQKMLALAMEVDSPTTSSNKICEDLHLILIGPHLHRHHRLLLLQTLESSLLQCKLVELLLQHVCADKTKLPMSLSLILHFLRSATLPPDPTDGVETWRRWRELVQLLWMLLLSYEEVTEGHLRRPITQRAQFSHAPIWTANDDITPAELQEAADCFLSRVSADLGHALPPQVQELFSYLRDHLLCFCRH